VSIRIASIVKGHGEVEALPILLRKIALALDPQIVLSLAHPIRVSKSKLVQPHQLEKAVEIAAGNMGNRGAILVLIDSDDDCPAELGPQLLARVAAARADMPGAVVLAKHEFEAWFLVGAQSLRGTRGLGDDLIGPADAESIRGPKEWLSARMPAGASYRETLHQAAFAAVVDLEMVQRASASFRKFHKEVIRLCTELRDA
jgi:Domain of unknown function (DUF4276)